MIDIDAVRSDFPILNKEVHGKPLVYLDNAATTHKPGVVLDKIIGFYTESYSNIHRGVHYLSDKASAAYEDARETVRDFINAGSAKEVIFTRGTTEAVNLVADSFGREFIKKGDEIIISEMEHHSNIVPWQLLCQRTGAVLKVILFEDDGSIRMDRLKKGITKKTKLISMVYVSNSLGVVNNVKEVIDIAKEHDIPVMIDGAQAVQHMPIDVRDIGCDFFAFSGHKIYADTGIGVLYGKEKWLDAMPPYQTGGGMIANVNFDKTTYAGLPYKFEAGTGNIVGAVSLATAVEYLQRIGMSNIDAYEHDLIDYAEERIAAVEGVTIYGKNIDRCAAISFNMKDIHHFDAGSILDKMGIAIRTGMHCTEPIMKHYGISGTIRASFALYNTKDEIDRLIEGLHKVKSMLNP